MIPSLTTDRLHLVPPSLAHLPSEREFLASERSSFVGGPASSVTALMGTAWPALFWRCYGAREKPSRWRNPALVVPWVQR